MKMAGLDDGPREFDDLSEPLGRINQTGQKAATYRSFTDTPALRSAVLDGVKDAYTKRVVENKQYQLRFADVDYKEPKDFSLKDEKEALLKRRRLYHNLHGRLQLLDKATGQVISQDEAPRKIAEVPWLSRRGTWIHNGTEYLSFNQMRLKPGAYTRLQTNGDVETQFNVLKGSGFRVKMTPDTGVFRMKVGQSELKLYPVLKALGVSDKDLHDVWGKDLLNANRAADDKAEGTTVLKVIERLGGTTDQGLSVADATKRLPEILARMEMDPGVTKRTLGKPYATVDHNVILAATKKILGVHKGEVDADERDDLPYQSFHGPEDFFREHVEKDAGQYLRQALFKASWGKDTKKVPDGYFTKQLQSVLMGSGLAASLAEINPIEIYDMRHKITRMGEGGIGSTDVVPKNARGVQPTHFGFLDPIRAPESTLVALDLRVAHGAKVGNDGRLYQDMRNVRTGKLEPVTTEDISEKVVAFPGELKKGTKKVSAMVGGQMRYVPRDKVDYELPHASQMWSPVTNMVPFMSGSKGQRVSMGSRMMTQALALKDPEAPLVRTRNPLTGTAVHRDIGKDMGATFTDKGGVVVHADQDSMVVLNDDGTRSTHELYNNFPLNQKGFIHSTAVAKVGQRVNPGDALAKSNYTNDKGESAIGRNVTMAFHAMDGLTHEDAIVVSASAAKKFASEQMYEFSKEKNDDIHDISKAAYVTKYGGTYNKAQLDQMDPNGVVKVGTILKKDDPIILAVGKRLMPVKGSITKGSKTDFSDAAETWEHDEPAEVVDVRKTTKGFVVSLKSYTPLKEADKLSGLYGNKGIISKIVPDHEMLKTADGKVIDVVMNPAGIVSRVNPAQLAEAALGKIAQKFGKTYEVDGFPDHSIGQFALDELAKHGMTDTETVTDPRTGRQIKDVFVGVPYIMKLHHMAEGKMGARDTGGYTQDELPAKGGPEGAKRIGLMEVTGLISHGATDFLEDMKMTRGQRNEDYWRMYRLGLQPPTPRISKMYDKFEHTLKAAGVHLRKEGSKTQVVPMTRDEVEKLAGEREITVADTVDFDTQDPVKGGLFDIGLTGGKDGRHWAHIKLAEAMPNPVVEDPIRSLLGLTKDKFRDVIAGRSDINGIKGSHGIARALETYNLPREIASTTEAIKSGKKSIRDKMVKKLGYLKSFERMGINPRDFMFTKVPVIPPKFRPVTQFQGMTMAADANYLYKDLMEANHNMKATKETFGSEDEDSRLQLYDAFKAVTGLGGPITPENQERQVKGLLKQITGTSPKFGMFQRKVVGNPVDLTGRAVLAPGHDMDIDEVGLPADMMWKVFKPFVLRRMARAGMPALQAMKEYKERTTNATKAMLAEAKVRPVVINRAPSLHKLNLTGHYAHPIPGHALKVSHLILAGHAGDYDGDTLNVHVPVSDKAVADVRDKMMPSKMLLSPGQFDVHLLPPHIFTTGLYAGSHKNSKKARVFNTKADAIKAYRSGDLDADDPVIVLAEK